MMVLTPITRSVTRIFRFSLSSFTLLFFLFTVSELALGDVFSLSDGGQEMVTAIGSERLSFTSPDNLVETTLPIHDPIAAKSDGTPPTTGKTKWLLQVVGPITDLWKTAIQDYFYTHGHEFGNLQLGHYIPQNTFVITGSKSIEFRSFLQNGPGVINVRLYQGRWKVSKRITQLLSDSKYLQSTDKILVRVQLFDRHNGDTSIADAQVILSQYRSYASTIPFLSESNVKPQLATYQTLLFTINQPQALSPLVIWLSQQDDILWIEERQPQKPHNFYARQTSQSDEVGQFPLSDRGLKGSGMTIGVADTALDYNSCFFAEKNFAPPTINTYQPNRRKIVYYKVWNKVQPTQVTNANFEHGTHTSGTVTGSIYDTTVSEIALNNSKFNGMAPLAKIAFVQLQGLGTKFSTPEPLTNVFVWHQSAQATVSSNSYGAPGGEYTVDAQNIDNYTKTHPNFLVLFAAGNSGDHGYKSVGAEGSAKNVITVGASFNTNPSYTGNGGLGEDDRTFILTFAPSGAQAITYTTFAGDQTFPLGTFPVIQANPFTACGTLTNLAAIKDKVVIIDASGSCSIFSKFQKAKNAGAKFLIIKSNTTSVDYKAETGPDNTVELPIAVISQYFWTVTLGGVAPSTVTVGELDYNEKNMIGFSGRGPTFDGRIKPDVVAPGVGVRSALGNGALSDPVVCKAADIHRDSGTSMSTPVTAGTALLVQEYFMKGFYPDGKSNATNGFTPLAALLKATIIASGVSMAGAKVRDPLTGIATVAPVPDPIQGFGRVQMDTVLLFDADKAAEPKKNLWVNKSPLVIKTGMRQSFCFQAFPRSGDTSTTSGQPLPSLRATLVWADPPAPAGADIALINNLDLAVVRVSDHKFYIGNQLAGDTWDSANNVEQITVPAEDITGTGEYFAVIVNGVNVPTTTPTAQNYGLIVNGYITKVAETNCAGTAAFCPNDCGSPANGTCVTVTTPDFLQGTCNCSVDTAGTDCSQANPLLAPTGPGLFYTMSGTVLPGKYEYFRIDLNQTDFQGLATGMKVSLAVLDRNFAADVFVNGFPPEPTRNRADFVLFGSRGNANTKVATWKKADMAVGLSEGGTVYVAVQGYCCGLNNFQINITFI